LVLGGDRCLFDLDKAVRRELEMALERYRCLIRKEHRAVRSTSVLNRKLHFNLHGLGPLKRATRKRITLFKVKIIFRALFVHGIE